MLLSVSSENLFAMDFCGVMVAIFNFRESVYSRLQCLEGNDGREMAVKNMPHNKAIFTLDDGDSAAAAFVDT